MHRGARGSAALPTTATRHRAEEKGIGQGERSAARAASHRSEAARGSCLSLVYVSREGVNLISVLGSISIRGEYCICIHSPLSPLDDRVPPSVVCFSAQEGLPINSAAAVDNAIVSLR